MGWTRTWFLGAIVVTWDAANEVEREREWLLRADVGAGEGYGGPGACDDWAGGGGIACTTESNASWTWPGTRRPRMHRVWIPASPRRPPLAVRSTLSHNHAAAVLQGNVAAPPVYCEACVLALSLPEPLTSSRRMHASLCARKLFVIHFPLPSGPRP